MKIIFEMLKDTLESISKRTGYSVSTVSRVLNGKADSYRISQTAIDVIQAEARKSNFTPCAIAQSLRNKRTNTIGLLIPSIDNPYFSNLANVIVQEAKSLGNLTMVVDSMESETNEKSAINSLLARKVDGIIAIPSGQDPSDFEACNNQIPIVLIDRYFPDTETLSYVCTDNYKGASMATQCLIDNGHRKIACIVGPPQSSTVRDRTRGFIDTLEKNGITDYIITGDSFSIQNGYLETKLLLNSKDKPTAIFCMSNTILLGAIKAIRESNYSIPDDISIISFDDSFYMDYLSPAITRISQPIYEIGVLAIKILFKKISEESFRENQIQLPPILIYGHSIQKLQNTY